MKKYLGLAFIVLSACGDMGLVDAPVADEASTPADSVKLISKNIGDGSDTGTYFQEHYVVNEDNRLLIRRESFLEDIQDIDITDDQPVELHLFLKDATERSDAIAALKLCPLRRNWMMLATWSQAHPFGSSGNWAKSGGDYRDSECVLPSAGTDEDELVYNVSEWTEERVLGFDENFGLILVSDDIEFKVKGDKVVGTSPVFEYTVLR